MVSPQTSPPIADPFRTSPLRTILKWVCSTPITILALYCVVSLLLEENYPFSHYPMYSNPGADRSYYIVADSEGQPIPIVDLTGITCPKVGKMYRKKAVELGKRLKLSSSSLPPEQQQKVGEEIFAQLRLYAKQLNKALPAKLVLQKVDVSYRDGKVSETPEVLAKE